MQQGKLTHAWTKASAASACVALQLSACAAVDDSLPTPRAPVEVSPAASTLGSPGPSLVATAEATAEDVYVSEAGGWSIVVPDGWELETSPDQQGAVLFRDQAIAEILLTPARGMTIEQLQAQQVEFLSAWPGAHDVESEIVRLLAGEAVRGSLRTTDPNLGPYVFISHVIKKGEWVYGISVRGPQSAGDLQGAAKALAESFAISTAPVATDPQRVCVVSETSPIGPNRIPAWGRDPLYVLGPMLPSNPGPRSFAVGFFTPAGSGADFVLHGEDAMTGAPLRFAYMQGGARRGELQPTLHLTAANAEDASAMGRGWMSWMVAVESNASGCYVLRAAEGFFGDEIEITLQIG